MPRLFAIITALGAAVAEGYMAGGVLPVIKHLPGHGRATADSHEALPVVDANAARERLTTTIVALASVWSTTIATSGSGSS